jgi:hypothetical protein
MGALYTGSDRRIDRPGGSSLHSAEIDRLREPKYQHSEDGLKRPDVIRATSIQWDSDVEHVRPACWCYKFNPDESHVCDQSSGLYAFRRPAS